MQKYNIRVFYNAYIDLEVETNSSDDAEVLACEIAGDLSEDQALNDLMLAVDFSEVIT
jgi:hypothetical protein